MPLTETDALRSYARMLNTLELGDFPSLLSPDFTYESQTVFEVLESAEQYLEYITAKLQAFRASNAPVYAEMGVIDAYGETRPCVVVAQPSPEQLKAFVTAEVEGDKLKRLDLCIVPAPETAMRSGEYPR